MSSAFVDNERVIPMDWEIVNLDMTFKVKADIETVFKAWTEPKLFKQWFMTMPQTNKVAANTLEVNGDWEIVDVRDGVEYRAIGTYIDIVEPYKLIFSFKMPQFSELEDIITVEFIDLQDETEVKFNHGIKVQTNDTQSEQEIEKAKSDAKSQIEAGYEMMFKGLRHLCETQSNA